MECPGNSDSGHKAFPLLPSHSQHLISYFKIRKMQYLYPHATGESQAAVAIKAYSQVSLPQHPAELSHPSGTLPQAASSQSLSWPVGARSSLLMAAQRSGMTSLLATKKMPGRQLLLAWDSPPTLLLHKAGSLTCQGRCASAAKEAVESLRSE